MDIEMKRVVRFVPAYDYRCDGGGMHCAELYHFLSGPKGTVQFALATGWYPDTIIAPDILLKPYASDLGIHSPSPLYTGHKPMEAECEWIPNGGPCYYDGSTLAAERIFQEVLQKGGDVVWKRMEETYRARFESPDPVGIEAMGFGEVMHSLFGNGDDQ